MPWRIVMVFPEKVGDQGNDLLSRVRNFGERLYLELREEKGVVISLTEIDRATDTLVVTLDRDLRRIECLLLRKAETDFPDRTPSLTTVKI